MTRWTPAVLMFAVCILTAGTATAQHVGWRTDGTGKYPAAKPLTTWGPTTNVLWKTPMPSASNATPVLVGDKLFVTAEPMKLICVDANTGEIIWEAENSFEDMATPEEAAQMAAKNQEARDLRRERGGLWGKVRRLKTSVQDDPENAELKKELEEAQSRQKEIDGLLAEYDRLWYSMPDVHPINGNSSATPASDGEHVWVSFATGLVACYDLDGNLVWRRMVEKPNITWGSCSSPVVVDDIVLIHIHHLFGLDKLTGETRYSPASEWNWGTPALMTLRDTVVAIDGSGTVIRVSDGKVMAQKLFRLEYNGPVVEGDVVYFIQNGGKAFRLSLSEDGESVNAEKLWDTHPKKERYYACPVVHDGLVYAINQVSVFSAIDAATGEVVYEQNLEFGKGTIYPSVTMAGEYLYVSSDNGKTAVIKPGPTFDQVAMNELEPFRSCPVFVGDKCYIRGLSNLYCLAPIGEG